ncbi:MAG: hypothetical protein OEZ02_10860 [Anaerolineae bacterium]|nr:hypothetical protein [Anaerolineae bacterium]
MTFDQLLAQVVKEGAIRIWHVTAAWCLVYRVKDGRLQARGLHQRQGSWHTLPHFIGGKNFYAPDGWYAVVAMHASAEPINLAAAKQNPGYYAGLEKFCYTCKQSKPLYAFERSTGVELQLRTWECDQCAAARHQELAGYQQNGEQHIGDSLRRETHASRPPVTGKI